MKTVATLILTATLTCTAMAAGPKGGTTPPPEPVLRDWMSPEVGEAWGAGYKGQGVTVTVVDDFRSPYKYYGNLTGKTELLRHGEWTSKEASLIAPSAKIVKFDFTSKAAVPLASGLNVLNLSYGMIASAGYGAVRWSSREASIIQYAKEGRAVVSKAAGNDYGTAVGEATSGGNFDYLNRDLIGKPSAIFVGALDRNGTVDQKASLASYSNVAGQNVTVQNQFLVVGVRGDITGLYGTSFAAPVVAGYAAIVGSKFTQATPTQVTNQLLDTARTDTILNYNAATHGRGEASLTRALAPLSIH